MRNLLSAILAITVLGALGCESCWEARDPAKEAAATAPGQPAPTTPAPAPTAPPAAVAATEPPKSPEELARNRDLENRRSATTTMRRFDSKQIRFGGQRTLAKPSMKFRPIRARPAPSHTTGNTSTSTAPAQPASGTSSAPAQ